MFPGPLRFGGVCGGGLHIASNHLITCFLETLRVEILVCLSVCPNSTPDANVFAVPRKEETAGSTQSYLFEKPGPHRWLRRAGGGALFATGRQRRHSGRASTAPKCQRPPCPVPYGTYDLAPNTAGSSTAWHVTFLVSMQNGTIRLCVVAVDLPTAL